MQRPRRAGRRAWLLALCAGLAGPAIADPDPRLAAAVEAIESAIARSGAEVAVAFRTLDGRSKWQRQAAQPFHAASTMKIPVLIELMRQRRDGRLRLDEPLALHNEFRSIVAGSHYALAPEDDSETELYRHLGESRTLGALADLMITVSSNLATNLLIERLGIENIGAALRELGVEGMTVLRGVEDNKAFAAELNNTTTAAALCEIMTALAQGRAVDRGASQEMLEILKRQQFNQGIPAGLPAGMLVAHKTGDITGVHHDAALVLAARPYVLVILTRGLEEAAANALMAEISRQLLHASQPHG